MKKKIKILLYLYYPFFDKHLAGGVQVWLRKLIEKLLDSNLFEINIICPDSDKHDYPQNISVYHTLVDMERDMVPLADINNNLNKIKELEKQSDIIWMIDRNFPIDTKKPKILSINTLCYEREAMSVFQSNWCEIVCTTNYVKKILRDFFEEKINNINIIPFFVDPIFFDNSIKKEILNKYFDYNSKNKYILFPHRVDPGKGHFTAIDILKKLVEEDDTYYLLIPSPSDAKEINQKTEYEYFERIKKYVKENKLEKNVVFHKWIDYEDLPTYYSCGEFTLFLSQLPETFGLVLLNSVSVGTPVISYGVGALNEVVPLGDAHFNITSVEDASNYIKIGKKNCNVEKSRKLIIEKYNMEKVVNDYINLFKKLYK